MINFTVGPVMSSKEILKIGGQQIPYFRTSEFSEVMFENEKLMSKFAKAPIDSRTVFIAGSGTAAMEAAVMNVFDGHDKVLIVDGEVLVIVSFNCARFIIFRMKLSFRKKETA